MEDDDDFGDLYTDVLQSFPSTSPAPQRGIDLNLEVDEEKRRDGATEILNSGLGKPLAPHVVSVRAELELNLSDAGDDSGRESGYRDVKKHGSEIPGLGNADGGGGGGGSYDEESFRFDLEEEAQDGDVDTGSEPLIPGLSTGLGGGEGFHGLGREESGGEDWDSDDSEDDLQIVLNDTNHGPIGMEMGGALGGELDDGQNEGLGICVEGDGVSFQHHVMEETEWGEDGAQAADGEKKEGGEVPKMNQGISMAAKPGYGGHGYHQFHSQFKYVRPGAAPLQGAPAAGPVGAPGQVRPLVSIGQMAGRGRGDWRPLGVKTFPGMQKEYGGPGWGNNAGGRGRGIGLDFTLPSHKTVFEVDIDSFEEKPWNNPGVDVTDFFNFGFTEESWKGYIKQLEKLRVASTMQSRIRVYESGRSDQAYDPDMPPELAAATGANEKAAENANFRTVDADLIDVERNLTPARPPIPTGRPIQVETGSGERPSSINTRAPRHRDSAIIEIVCEAFVEGQSSEDGTPLPSEHGEPSKTQNTENQVREEVPVESKQTEVHSSGEMRLPSPSKAPHHSEPSGSRGETPAHSSGSEDRRRLEDRSPHSVSRDSDFHDDQRAGSTEQIDGKRNVSASPGRVKDDHEMIDVQKAKDDDDDDIPLAVDSATMEDDILCDKAHPAQSQDTILPHSKRINDGSVDYLSSGQDNEDDLKEAKTGDAIKSRPGNSKEHLKSYNVGEIITQGGCGANVRKSKRHDDERKVRKNNAVEKDDVERSRDVVKGREDPYAHRDGGQPKPLFVKYESSEKRKERDSYEGVWQRRDEDPHGRRVRANDYVRQEPQLLERGDEMSSKYSGKGWEGDRIEKDDSSYSRKQTDNGSWRGHHDKDVSLRQRERGESLRLRHENVDDSRMRKNEENPRRDYSEKEALLRSHRESPSLQKREREDLSDLRRRDDQTRIRDHVRDRHSIRQKDEVRVEREKSERHNGRDDRQRTKQYHEASMAKREREEIREPLRSGRGTEDKWASHSKEKDEYNDAARYAESKRRDRVDDVHLLLHRGPEDKYARRNPSSNRDSNSRKEGPSSHINHNASVNHKTTDDDKPRETTRNKEYDPHGEDSLHASNRPKEDRSTHRSEKGGTKLSSGQKNSVPQTQSHLNLTRKRVDEHTTDDEQQRSKKGKSKMERWTSHKERDFAVITNSTSSLNVKDTVKSSINTESLIPAEPADTADKSSTEEKAPQEAEKKGSMKEVENKNSNPLQTADQHLDTVEKLKKRSERFKLPMPSEKDTTNKKPETEPLLPSQTETPPADPEVKSERPPRKRRWISS